MKYVTLTLTHAVTGDNFCTSLSGKQCRFCQDLKGGRHYCCLYDEMLVGTGDSIEKTRACCNATAGFRTTVEERPDPVGTPTVDPKVIMKETIKIYNKTVNELLSQGYPRQLAEKLATQAVLGGK